jgi:hypothetical protein
VIEIAPELLEAVRRGQRIGVVAEVVLPKLAGGIAFSWLASYALLKA